MDISDINGLFDLISVGCLVELSQALDERNYIMEAIPDDEQDEIDAATTRYRLFIRWFSYRFLLVIGGEFVKAQYIFKRRLVDFAATLVRYVKEQQFDTHKASVPPHHLTPRRMAMYIRTHLLSGWSELIPAFETAMPSASPRLYYTGQAIKLRQVDRQQLKALRIKEIHDFSGDPLSGNPLVLALSTSLSAPQVPPSAEESAVEEEQEDTSSPLSSPTWSTMLPPSTPTRKRIRPSPASTPTHTPSSSRPKKRAR
jgi:hypothetical protein